MGSVGAVGSFASLGIYRVCGHLWDSPWRLQGSESACEDFGNTLSAFTRSQQVGKRDEFVTLPDIESDDSILMN